MWRKKHNEICEQTCQDDDISEDWEQKPLIKELGEGMWNSFETPFSLNA